MKIIVRAFVVALALTGAVATASVNNNPSAKATINRSSSYAIPSCWPGDMRCAGSVGNN